MVQAVVKCGAPMVANDVLRWTKQVFNFGIKCQIVETNPAAAFDTVDAGGKEYERFSWRGAMFFNIRADFVFSSLASDFAEFPINTVESAQRTFCQIVAPNQAVKAISAE